MNEQIQTLAEQAGLYDEQTPEEVPGFTMCFEKFSVLLIEECCSIVMGDKTISWEDSIRIKKAIEENFGVK